MNLRFDNQLVAASGADTLSKNQASAMTLTHRSNAESNSLHAARENITTPLSAFAMPWAQSSDGACTDVEFDGSAVFTHTH